MKGVKAFYIGIKPSAKATTQAIIAVTVMESPLNAAIRAARVPPADAISEPVEWKINGNVIAESTAYGI